MPSIGARLEEFGKLHALLPLDPGGASLKDPDFARRLNAVDRELAESAAGDGASAGTDDQAAFTTRCNRRLTSQLLQAWHL